MTDLNSMLPTGSGWLLESATAINESGQIAGSGKHNGLLHAFLLTRVTAMNVTTVSAADYKGVTLAPEGIVSAFGTDLATTTQAAIATPLPLELAGTQVTLRDSSGADHAAPLFFVSPFQINFQLPSDTPTGTATVTIINGDRTISVGSIQIASVSPSIFTADSSGQGAPAGLLLRIKANQQQSYEPLARFDPAQKKYVPAPVIRQAGDQLFLVFFGTGMRNAPESDGNPHYSMRYGPKHPGYAPQLWVDNMYLNWPAG